MDSPNMKLTMTRHWQGAMAGLPPVSRMVGILIGVLSVLFLALLFGVVAAYFPASFTAKLVILVGGGVAFFAALLVPSDTKAPLTILRRLLYILLIVWVAWPVYLSYHGLPGPGINPTRLIYWSVVALWFFWLIASRDMRALLASRVATFKPFVILLFVYLGWALFCTIFSKSTFFSMYYEIKLMIGPVLVFFIALSCLRGRKDVDLALLLMVIAALVACGVGLLEAKQQSNLFYNIVPSLFPQGDEGASFWAEKLASDKSRAGSYRVMSTFTHPLTFGEYLALSLPLAAYLVGYSSTRWQRLLGLGALPAMLAGLYLTHTRSPLIAAGVAVILLVAFLGIRALRQQRSFAISVAGAFSLIALAFAAFAMLGIVTELILGRNAAETGSSIDRLIMLERGTNLILAEPITGYGAGMAAFTLGYLPGLTTLTIDNFYLSLGLESGLPGLALFLFLLGYPILKGFYASLRMPGQDGARISVIITALIGFAVVKSVLSLTDNLDAVFLLIALLAISLQGETKLAPQAGAEG
jgi:O-antigen ligase